MKNENKKKFAPDIKWFWQFRLQYSWYTKGNSSRTFQAKLCANKQLPQIIVYELAGFVTIEKIKSHEPLFSAHIPSQDVDIDHPS